jgi:transitional endoplasmic reticulum ATPase
MRGSGSGDSGATERVVNQILTSVDGLESMEGVVVLAATNRPDILDSALLRPGRFDRMVLISVPDKETRFQIFKVHTKLMPLKGVDLNKLADATNNYVGADIEGLCREAAMQALRKDPLANQVTMAHFEAALKVIRPSVTEEIIKYYEGIKEKIESGITKSKRESFGYYA